MLIKLFLTLLLSFSTYLIGEQRTIVHEGMEREYILHVPKKLNQDTPIVFVIHGYTGSAEGMVAY